MNRRATLPLAALVLLTGCWERDGSLAGAAQPVQPVAAGYYFNRDDRAIWMVQPQTDGSYALRVTEADGKDGELMRCQLLPVTGAFHLVECPLDKGFMSEIVEIISPESARLYRTADDFAAWRKAEAKVPAKLGGTATEDLALIRRYVTARLMPGHAVKYAELIRLQTTQN